MANQSLSFKQKVFKSLYGMGLKNFGPQLLGDLRKGSPEWVGFVQTLLESEDYASRKVALKQLTTRGFVEKSRNREALIRLLLAFMQRGLGEEKRAALKFVDQNLKVFPTDDDGFRGIIMQLQRETDPVISSTAEAMLPKIGINLDDPDLYRR